MVLGMSDDDFLGTGLAASAVIIPIVCLPVIGIASIWEFAVRRPRASCMGPRQLFAAVRKGWVEKMHLTGQAAANSTRDYLRVVTFLGSASIIASTAIAGFAANHCEGVNVCDATSKYRAAKLNVLAALFLVIFYFLLQSMRFHLMFHFMMNVDDLPCNRSATVKMPHGIMVKMFDQGHWYLSVGIRLYYFRWIFCWIFADWALLAETPFQLTLVYGLESGKFMEKELKQLEEDFRTASDGGSQA
ncbi:unnamed protein product [Chrysoparadoxa australica]